MEQGTLNYADAEQAQRPLLVLRLVALTALAVVISEAHLIARPTELTWESLWAFGVLPLLVVAGIAGFTSIPKERLWLITTAVVAIIVAMIPIGEGWDAVTIAFEQSSTFGLTMVHQQVGTNFEALVLVLACMKLVITCTALRFENSPTLATVALVIVCLPIAGSRVEGTWMLIEVAVRSKSVEPVLVIYAAASGLVILGLIALPWTRGLRQTCSIAACLLGVVVLLGVLAYAIAKELGPAELLRPRLLSNKVGPLVLTAAPALAVLVTRTKKPRR